MVALLARLLIGQKQLLILLHDLQEVAETCTQHDFLVNYSCRAHKQGPDRPNSHENARFQ